MSMKTMDQNKKYKSKQAKNHKQAKIKIYTKSKTTNNIDNIIQKLENTKVDISKVVTFKDLPLSPLTQKGLLECGFLEPTEIQKESLAYSLQGLDVLGAAKTGSGKTLAFLIPVLETLFKKKWTRLDGLGALIITPVRELAYQIFETLKKVGRYHDFSAGLIIGGKDLHFERNRLDQINIVICTPGRLLQHMDENPCFDCVNMQILILDEADRCLDMGFEKSMNCIIENLPSERQTLLFSATQTKSVRDLARLSLKDPKYVAVHEHARHSTPDGLVQSFVECELHDKIAMLWSFIKNHNKHKILVFFATCKQVKYVHEIFTKLRPPITILPLYGRMNQQRRMSMYDTFARKQHSVLFATDIASRGLDFPEVNWVIQLDCPEDANTYIHRAGRTARYHKDGESLLILLPSEKEAMLKHLEDKKIPINEIKINPSKLTNPQIKMEAFLAKDQNLKGSAQRAFKAYIKDILFMKDKSVFKINAVNTDLFARSLGLVVCPRIRAVKKGGNQELKMKNEDNSFGEMDSGVNGFHSEYTSQEVLKGKELYDFGGDDSDDDLFVVKRRDHELEGCSSEQDEVKNVLDQMNSKSKKKPITKIALAKKILKKKIVANKKIVFSETGDSVQDEMKARTTEIGRQYDMATEGGINIDDAKQVMKAEDEVDRRLFRDKIKAKHREERLKAKELRRMKKRGEDDEVKAYSGSESDEGPDLSWLPDPDKIYGEKSDTDSEDEQTFTNRTDKAADKRKKKQNDSKPVKRLKEIPSDLEDEDEPLDTGFSLKEDEDLVLQFLSKR